MTLTLFNDAIYSVYNATLCPDHWSSALDDVASLSGSNGAILYAKRSEGWVFPIYSQNVTGAIDAYVREGWSKQNPWLESRTETGFRVGDVYRDLDIVTPEEMSSNPFYTEFLHRFGLGRQMVAVIYSDLGSPTCLVAHREMSKGPFRKDEMDTHLLVARHLEQSLRMSSEFSKINASHESLSHVFDAMDRPAFILDEGQKPLKLNRSAQNLMDNYFVHRESQLRPIMPHEEMAFSNIVRKAHNLMPTDDSKPEPATISGKNGEERLVVWSLPLVGSSADKLGFVRSEKNVLVLAQPLQQNRLIDLSVIRSIYGLTTGEARLASLLAAGRNVKQAAVELGLTEGTARFVLKRIFQKMDIHRQSDLVLKINNLGI